jgi:predicted secreted hydrolase
VNPLRRALLHSGLIAGASGLALGHSGLAHALSARALAFPRDHGSHPDFKTEWWYVTGFLQTRQTAEGTGPGQRQFGFQVTFFRSRVEATQGMASKFAAKQLLFAHAAVTDVAGKVLLHDQRMLREGFDVARADTQDTGLQIKDWSLLRTAAPGGATGAGGGYSARVKSGAFDLSLALQPQQAVLLQGDKGLSSKGPLEANASFYYSQPQLVAQGQLRLGSGGPPMAPADDVSGTAWLDHEWSQALLPANAVGWDWIGMNLFDGSALMAFQLRDRDGKPVWDGGTFRTAGGQRFGFSRGEVVFSRQKSWKSPASQASYPVEWIVRTPADFFTVKAVIPNQELDSRATTGALYWEGLSELFDSNGKLVGRGYLEMTGYARPIRL